MAYIATSCVFFLGSLVAQAEGYISDDWGYELVSLPGAVGEAPLKAVKLFLSYLNSTRPVSQVPWPNRATGFALLTIASACLSLVYRVSGFS